MENSKLNLVCTNRIEKHNGEWLVIWEGTVTTFTKPEGENVRVYIKHIQPISEPPLKFDGQI